MPENYEITAESLKDGEGRTVSVIVTIHSPDGTTKTAAIDPNGMIIASTYDKCGQFIDHDIICPACWFAKAATSAKKPTKRFTPPTIEEVRKYCNERGNRVDPAAFVSFYDSNGWKVGKNPMKDWRAAVRTWEQREGGAKNTKKSNDFLTAGTPHNVLTKYAKRG